MKYCNTQVAYKVARFVDNHVCCVIVKLGCSMSTRKEAMAMKKIVPSLVGMAVILALGQVYAGEDMSAFPGTDDKTMNMDRDHATVNQMPAESGTAGTGAKEMNKDSDSAYKDREQGTAPGVKAPTKGSNEGSGAGGSSDPYYPSY